MDFNDVGPFIPAALGIIIGVWLIAKAGFQAGRFKARAKGVINDELQIVTEGPGPDNPDDRVREIKWQALYSFEVDGKTYDSKAEKNGTHRFNAGDSVIVNYNPANPARSFIEDDRVKSAYPWVFIIGGVVISTLLILIIRLLN